MPKTKTPSPAMTFAVTQLKKNPNAEFSKLAAAAKGKGLSLIPIVFGRAKLALGLSKPKSAAAGKPGRKPAGRGPGRPPGRPLGRPPGRPPGRPAVARAGVAMNVGGMDSSVGQLLQVVKQAEVQREALAQIQAILGNLDLGGKRGPGRPRKFA